MIPAECIVCVCNGANAAAMSSAVGGEWGRVVTGRCLSRWVMRKFVQRAWAAYGASSSDPSKRDPSLGGAWLHRPWIHASSIHRPWRHRPCQRATGGRDPCVRPEPVQGSHARHRSLASPGSACPAVRPPSHRADAPAQPQMRSPRTPPPTRPACESGSCFHPYFAHHPRFHVVQQMTVIRPAAERIGTHAVGAAGAGRHVDGVLAHLEVAVRIFQIAPHAM